MNKTGQQTLAIAKSECLRMATSPAWAILLFLWTLVCGLFFQIVINYAAANALPVGETPMSYFFRTAPFLLPLLLIIFVPQLTMDVVAGRRERGRMDHLLISGMRPGSLILGSFFAICCLLMLLVIPPLIFHGIVAIHASPDFGKTCSALISLFLIGASIAGLGLCVSCWAPNRLAASLIAVSIGITWWIIDVFGQQIDQGDNWEVWRASLALSLTVYDSASGLVEPRLFISFISLTLCLLYIARCGLDWQRYPRSLIISSFMAFIIGLVVIGHFQSWNSRWDFTSYQTHSMHNETMSAAKTLIQEGGVQVTLASTPAIRSDPLDGPVYERCQHLLKRLAIEGLILNEMDPALDPNGANHLSRECSLNDSDWLHPLIIVRHLDKHIVLKAKQLAVYHQQEGRLVLKALRCEGALLGGLQYLKDGHHKQIAWLQNDQVRPLSTTVLHQRNRTMQSAFQRLKSDGYNVQTVATINQFHQRHHLLVIPGLQSDISEAEAEHLLHLLKQGTSILFFLDGQEHPEYKQHLSGLLNDFGINMYPGSAVQIDKDNNPLSSITCAFTESAGPFTLIQQDQKLVNLVWGQPISVNPSKDQNYLSSGHLQPLKTVALYANKTISQINEPIHFIAFAHSKQNNRGHAGVIGSVDSFSDAHIHQATNGLCLSLITKYLLGREIENVLEPESVQANRFELSTAQKLILIWCVGIGLPLLSGGVGAFIAWRRRRVS